MLTGRCKEEFDKWYLDRYKDTGDFPRFENFIEYDFSMQYGVYVDFFDSVGIDINIFQTPMNCFRLYIKVNGNVAYNPMREQNEEQTLKRRTEARTKAIEKANELFNTKEI